VDKENFLSDNNCRLVCEIESVRDKCNILLAFEEIERSKKKFKIIRD
jgi:hypothetical protein